VAADGLKRVVVQGLSATKAGSDVAALATDDISNDASHPDLKAALEEGNRTSRQWASDIDRAMEQAGNGQQTDDPVLDALYDVSRRIRSQAREDQSRDLGTVANGQLALHYRMAAFGTMANYLNGLGWKVPAAS